MDNDDEDTMAVVNQKIQLKYMKTVSVFQDRKYFPHLHLSQELDIIIWFILSLFSYFVMLPDTRISYAYLGSFFKQIII